MKKKYNGFAFAPLCREEYKLGISLNEKIESDIYINRGTARAIDYHLRLMEAKSLESSRVAQDGIQKIAYNKSAFNNEANIKPATVKASVVKVDPKSNKTSELPVAKVKEEPKIETKPVANPQLAECYYIRALQKYILQKRESALKDFDMAIYHNPNYAEAYYYRAAIKRDFQDEGFVDDYKKAIQLDPKLKAVDDANVLTILKI
jgi:tetratricopeptide (TPR) repeat protein